MKQDLFIGTRLQGEQVCRSKYVQRGATDGTDLLMQDNPAGLPVFLPVQLKVALGIADNHP